MTDITIQDNGDGTGTITIAGVPITPYVAPIVAPPSDPVPSDPPPAPTITGQTLTADKTEIHVGDTFALTGVLDYSDASSKPVSGYRLYGFDKTVVTAANSYTPKFTAVAAGTTTIKNDNAGTTGALVVTVLSAGGSTPPTQPAPIEPISAPTIPTNDNATHQVVATATDRLGRVFTASATVGNDPTAAAQYVKLTSADGNEHPGLTVHFYADGCELGARRADNAYDWLGFTLKVTYDGAPAAIPAPSNADGTVDFWRGCAMPMIRYGTQVGWDASRIDWSLYPNFDRSPQAAYSDAGMDYTFNGLGCATTRGMPNTGERDDIGYASRWTMAFLTAPSDATWAVIRRCADHDGKWRQVAFCDPATGRIIDVETWPDANLLPAAQRSATWKNPIVPYAGAYDGDTLTPPRDSYDVGRCPNIPSCAHLTDYGMLAAMITGTARDRDHASFCGNYPLLEGNPVYRQSTGIVYGQPRVFAWGLRSLFMAAYVSSDTDYFSRRVDRQIEIANGVQKNAFGIWDVDTHYKGTADATGYTGMVPWEQSYLAITLDAVQRKRANAKPLAQYIGSFVTTWQKYPFVLVQTVYSLMCRDPQGQPMTDFAEMVRLSLITNYGFTSDEATAVTSAATVEDAFNAVQAYYKARGKSWSGECVNGVASLWGSLSPDSYIATAMARAAAAYNAGVSDADKAVAYMKALPTQPDFSKNAKYHVVAEAA